MHYEWSLFYSSSNTDRYFCFVIYWQNKDIIRSKQRHDITHLSFDCKCRISVSMPITQSIFALCSFTGIVFTWGLTSCLFAHFGINKGTRLVDWERNHPSVEWHANHQAFYMNLKHQFACASLHLFLLLSDQQLLDADLDIGFKGVAALAIYSWTFQG